MKKYIVGLFFAVMVVSGLVQAGCAGSGFIGVSVPVGYPTWGGGGSVTIGVGGPVIIGRPWVH